MLKVSESKLSAKLTTLVIAFFKTGSKFVVKKYILAAFFRT